MENNPHMPSQLPPNQGYLPISLSQPYQQMSSQPNQGPVSGSQSSRPRRVLRRSRGLTMMLQGVILIVGGIVLSLISYSCASSVADTGGAGYYTIFTGAVVIGAIYAIVGFLRWILGR
jgi:hypothetical protein